MGGKPGESTAARMAGQLGRGNQTIAKDWRKTCTDQRPQDPDLGFRTCQMMVENAPRRGC
jgi:hypothetical protein